MYTTLQQLAYKYEVGIDAIALRFCMDSVQPFAVLSGASEIHHLDENLKAAHFALTDGEIESLKQFGIAPPPYWKERKALPWN